MTSRQAVLTVIAIAGLAPAASAQLATTRILTLDAARTIAEGALARCRQDGLEVTVVVVDRQNAAKVILGDDGATAATAEAARMKATTAMLHNRLSGPAVPPPAGTPVPPAAIPGTFNSQGGVPIVVDGKTIGAVAVSGTTNPNGGQEKDVLCARAGIESAKDKLR